jgi:hydroxypyruvate isomerase
VHDDAHSGNDHGRAGHGYRQGGRFPVHISGLSFDVNCSILFTELPLLQRPAAAKAAGFDAVEFWWPFAEPVPADHEVDAFITALDDAGVSLVALNFAAGDMAAGERGWLSQPGRSSDFRANIPVCTGIAKRTGCTRLNALYGNRVEDVAPQRQDELAAQNLKLAAQAAAGAGAVVLIEALNSHESPAYPLVSAASAAGVAERVSAATGDGPGAAAAFLADLYHLGRMGEDLAGVLSGYRDWIGHVQIADVPGRGAPGTGTIGYEALLRQLAAQGYRGYVGLEYKPTDPKDSSGSFGWLDAPRPGSPDGSGRDG